MSLFGRIFARGRTRAPDPHPYWVPVNPIAAGVAVTPYSALTLSAVFACIRCIAEDIAALPWHALERDGDRRRETEEGLGDLLNVAANEEMGAVAFRTALLASAIAWGNGYAEIERNGRGQARALHLLAPDRVEPKRDDQGRLVYEVAQPDSGAKIVLPAADVFHVAGLGWDGVRGYSVVHQAALDLGIALAQNNFAAGFFGNGAHPGLAIEVPATIGAESVKTMRAELIKEHGGPRRAGRPLVLDAGAKIQRITVPPNEAQFLESRQFSIEEVCRWFRVPPHKIQHLARATFSNIEHQGQDYVTSALMPWSRRLENEADRKLCFGYVANRTKISLSALMRADSGARGTYYQTMRNMGVLSVNDIRRMEDMDPIGPEGDVYVMQQQYVPLEMLGERPQSPGVASGDLARRTGGDGHSAGQPAEPAEDSGATEE